MNSTKDPAYDRNMFCAYAYTFDTRRLFRLREPETLEDSGVRI